MGGQGEMHVWRSRLGEVAAELAEQEEAAARAGDWTPRQLSALAAERDKLADEWDQLAEAHDARADERDLEAGRRESQALLRDRAARSRSDDADEGFGDRFLAARDRDDAVGDRGESRAERALSRQDRARAASARSSAAADREAALQKADATENELAGLRETLAARHVIGVAQGILMERYDLDADRALAMLVSLARDADRAVHSVAELIATGRALRFEPTE